MAELTEEQKHELVTMLARFKSPSEIKAHFASEYELDMALSHIAVYDPTRPAFNVGEKWRTIFEAVRTAYLEDVSAVPIANQGYRLQILQEEMEKARKRGNAVLVADLLEQAAKEVGGLLTNARELNVKNDRASRVGELSPEERREAVVDLLRKALEEKKQEALAPAGVVIENQPKAETA